MTAHTLIVGGSAGMGFATARKLAAPGQRVTITGRSQQSVEAASAKLRDLAPDARITGLVLNLADFEGARSAIGGAGAIDNLVLVGSSDLAWGPFANVSMGAVNMAIQVKLLGYMNAIQAALPQLAERGSITILGGAAGRTAMPGTAGLAAVNGALQALTITLAKELAPRRVNLVSPGVVDTEAYDSMPAASKQALFEGAAARLPVGRVGQPDEVADVIATVVGAGFMSGSIIDIDGGARLN